jgi:hypothetical protein
MQTTLQCWTLCGVVPYTDTQGLFEYMLNTQLGERSAGELKENMAAAGKGLLMELSRYVSADSSTWDLRTTTTRSGEMAHQLASSYVHCLTTQNGAENWQ